MNENACLCLGSTSTSDNAINTTGLACDGMYTCTQVHMSIFNVGVRGCGMACGTTYHISICGHQMLCSYLS